MNLATPVHTIATAHSGRSTATHSHGGAHAGRSLSALLGGIAHPHTVALTHAQASTPTPPHPPTPACWLALSRWLAVLPLVAVVACSDSKTATTPTTPPPPVPVAPTLSVDSSSQITVTVPDGVSDVVDYEVWRGTTDTTADTTTDATKIAQAITTTHVDKALTHTTPYFYFLKACNASTCSALGASATATTAIVFTQIQAGDDHTCALTSSGRIYCWGRHHKGQLGLGQTDTAADPDTDPDDILTPRQTGTSDAWSALSSGFDHTCAITSTGELHCWGNNGDGQLGIDNTTDQNTPTRVGTATNWSAVAAGDKHTCAINTDGALYCWGENNDGKLGQADTDTESFATPQRVGTATNWLNVIAGEDHSCATTTVDMKMFCWGKNNDGELGLGNTDDQNTPQELANLTGWSELSAGFEHTCASQTAGRLYCWGENNDYELGIDNTDNQEAAVQVGMQLNWRATTAGGNHSCAVNTGGELYCWGAINDAEETVNLVGNATTAEAIQTPTRIGTAENWSRVDAGDDHICASTTEGTLFCWGLNANGQLGLSNTTQQATPQQIIFTFE
ncbi:MAG: hypothetical protein K0U66_00190 [Gammaproteobacteria bacterium]|nr:hypothetical protein [Gammaproteobacteria bacterium]